MAGGFESSGFKSSNFKRTFTVEKSEDGNTVIKYKAQRQRSGLMIFLYFLACVFLMIGIAAMDTEPLVGWSLISAVIAILIFFFWPIKGSIVIHQEGFEFLGKKLAFRDINATGVMKFGGGTSVYSVNGNVSSESLPKSYAPYATAFGQDILLTKPLKDDTQATGILEVVRQALNGQAIETQEQTSSSSLDTSKITNWLLTSKIAKLILILIVVKYILAVLNIF